MEGLWLGAPFRLNIRDIRAVHGKKPDHGEYQLSRLYLLFLSLRFASCMLFFITLFAGELNFSFPGEAWKIIVLFSLDGGLLATVLLQCSVSFIGSAKSAILGALEPVTSMAVGIAILG